MGKIIANIITTPYWIRCKNVEAFSFNGMNNNGVTEKVHFSESMETIACKVHRSDRKRENLVILHGSVMIPFEPGTNLSTRFTVKGKLMVGSIKALIKRFENGTALELKCPSKVK